MQAVINKNPTVIIVTDDMVMVSSSPRLTIDSQRDHIDVTSWHDSFRSFVPTRSRIKLEGELCETVLNQVQPGSDGWDTLLQLVAGRIMQRQVSRGLQTFLSSEHGARMKEMDAKMAALEVSALLSLEEAAERAMVALKRRVTRAKKHISTFAHGSRKSLQRAQSKKGSPGAKPRSKK